MFSGGGGVVYFVDGITLTVSNAAPITIFFANPSGLAVLDEFVFFTNSFNLTFSSPVQLIGYTVGFVTGLDGDESLTLTAGGEQRLTLTAGSSTSLESSPFVVGPRNFANQFNVAANQTISVTAGGAASADFMQWLSITANPVSAPTAVPEPSSLIALGVVGLGLFGLKKKSKG